MSKRKSHILTIGALLFVTGTLYSCGSGANQEAGSYRQEGIEAMAQDSYGRAEDLFDQAILADGNARKDSAIQNYLYKALAQFQSGNSDGAITTYGQLISPNPKLADAYYLRGNAYLSKGDVNAAHSDFQALLKLRAKDLKYPIYVYESFVKYDQTEQGKQYLQYVIDNASSSKEDFRYRGKAELYLGQEDAGISDLKKSTSAGNLSAYVDLVRYYDKKPDAQQADQTLQEYQSKNLKGLDYHELGGILLERGDYENAQQTVEKGLKLGNLTERERRLLLADQVVCLEHLNQYEQAKSKAEAYLQKYPSDASMLREKRLIDYAQKSIEELNQ